MHLLGIESIQRRYEHVYVSPHLDDVVLSCGGRIIAQRNQGDAVLIVTVFTGDIEDHQKPGGEPLHRFMNTQERRAEDEGAMRRLGVDYLWLDYPEALYRQGRPFSIYSVMLRRSGADAPLCEALVSDIRQICEVAGNDTLYLPFGVGQHVDHRIVFQIGPRLLREGEQEFDLCFYEDVPYTLIPNVLRYRMKLVGLNVGGLRSAKDLTQKKPVMQEVAEIYHAIVDLPTVTLDNSLVRALVFLSLLLGIIVVIYLPKPLRGVLAGRKIAPEAYDITATIQQKLAAILEYRSQLDVLFGDQETISASLLRYSHMMGGSEGQYLERYWKVVG